MKTSITNQNKGFAVLGFSLPTPQTQNRYTPRLKMAMPFLVLRIFRNKINGISKLVYSTLAIRVYGQGDLG
jgi:hypothetical protein